MKKIVYLLLLVLAFACAHGQGSKPTWNATIKVLDESGQPITGADVEMSWYVTAPDGSETFAKTEGLTDANGMFITSHEANRSIGLGFTARKPGYYSTTKGHEFVDLNDSDPGKLNPHVSLVLKKIGNPIPMYVKRVVYIKFPNFNTPVGYDLTVGDWVAPYGKGIDANIFFTENHPDAQSGYTFTVSFPRREDGIQKSNPSQPVQNASEGVSDLRSSYEAPVDGYQPTYEQTSMPDPNHNYYFRTTLPDGVHYGKIYGDFMQFTYYLNPTPNDRNVEFQPGHNLLGRGHSFEQVSAP